MRRLPDPETTAARLRELSTGERAAFVANLLAAAGWDVEREGRLLVATRDGRQRRVAVDTVPRGTAVDEVVVVPAGGWRPWPLDGERRARRRAREAGATVLEPAALCERLRYGLDRTTARHLVAEHLGPAALDGSDPAETGGGLSRRARVAGVVLAAAAVVAVAGSTLLGGPPAVPGAGPVTATVTAADTPAGAAGSQDTEGPPPGVGPDRLVSVDALTRAHLRAIGARPGMSMNATFAGPRSLTGFDTFRSGFDADDRVTVRVRVESASRYLICREIRFPGGLVEATNASLERFADGEAEYRSVSNAAGRRYSRRPLSSVRGGAAEVAGWTRTVFPRYLDTTRSNVVDAGGDYRVVATGEPRRLSHDTRSYRAVAVVAPEGFVRRLAVEYVHPRTGTTVRVTVRYGREPAAVAAPEWYGTARNRTTGEPSLHPSVATPRSSPGGWRPAGPG